MIKTAMPILYHPSNVLLLDDDRRFLNAMATNLDDSFPFVLLDDPRKAIDYLSSHTLYPHELVQAIARQNFEISAEKNRMHVENYDIDLSALKGDLEDANRFKKILVAMVDHIMPAMDGLEFCRHVREDLGLPIKFILLTGATSANEALAAFNSGIIDGFLVKHVDDEMTDKLNILLQKLIRQQFCEISQQVIGLMGNQFSHIFDPRFYDEFERVRVANMIEEFYLIDSSGSFLLIDAHGAAKIMLVRTDDDFEMMYDLARDSKAMLNVLQGLRDRQHFPFTHSGIGHLSLEGDEWDSIMVPMQKIPGRDIFYTLINAASISVTGYNKYRDEIWPKP